MATEGQEDALAAATAAAAASECQGLLVSTRFFEVFVYIHGANVGAVVRAHDAVVGVPSD